jgi:hypothetical protein
VKVIPISTRDGRWWPHVEIADEAGNVVRDLYVAAVQFPTSAEAERAGWSVAEAWIRRRVTET